MTPAGAVGEEVPFALRFGEKGKVLNFHVPFEQTEQQQRDSSEASHVSSLAASGLSAGQTQGREPRW